jgi:hypothetical protein
MLKGLSLDDRRAWDRLRKDCMDDKEVERALRSRIPPALQKKIDEETDLSPEEDQQLKVVGRQVGAEQIDRCLREAGMSGAGRARVVRSLPD